MSIYFNLNLKEEKLQYIALYAHWYSEAEERESKKDGSLPSLGYESARVHADSNTDAQKEARFLLEELKSNDSHYKHFTLERLVKVQKISLSK